MNITNLPWDIFPGETGSDERIIIHSYSAMKGSLKGKSILHTNAISLVIQGEKTMHFANKVLNITSNEIHFLSAGNCLASVNLSRMEIFRSILIFFTDKALFDFYAKYAPLTKKVNRQNGAGSQPFVLFEKDPFIINFIESLEYMLREKKLLSPEMRQLKFEELMLYLLEKSPDSILSFRPSERKDLNDLEIKKVMEMNITNSITVEELAFLCNISLSTFKRRFADIYGTSPNKWILHRRIEQAKHLLLHHREKPGEVYFKVGYENHSSFSQAFRQIVGMTPSEFQFKELDLNPQSLNR
jgi:AraC-like DNA-binding protein